jgi:hypothetical protein
LLTVTAAPDWVSLPFHRLLISWSPGKVQPRFQPLSALEPVLVTVICPSKPPCHADIVE